MPDSSPWWFFLETYDTERLKTLATWSTFRDEDLRFRCAERARTPLEHMVHQCVSEDTWFRTMLGIELLLPPLPAEESRLGFMRHYASASAPVYSTYGPTADTGGLFANHAPTVYRYHDVDELLASEADGGAWPTLPGPGEKPVTERP